MGQIGLILINLAVPFATWCFVAVFHDLLNGRRKSCLSGIIAGDCIFVFALAGVISANIFAAYSFLRPANSVGLVGFLGDERTTAIGRGLVQIGVVTSIFSMLISFVLFSGYGRRLCGLGFFVLLVPILPGAVTPTVAFRLARRMVEKGLARWPDLFFVLKRLATFGARAVSYRAGIQRSRRPHQAAAH